MDQINENLGTIIGVAFVYIIGKILEWWRNRKPKADIKDNLVSILEMTKGNTEDIRHIKSELSFNGGHSLKDMVHEMKGTQDARFYFLMNQENNSYFNLDTKGQLIFANSSMCEMFGMHYKEMTDKDWIKAIGETQKERDDFYNALINAVRQEIPFEYSTTITNQKVKEKIICSIQFEAQRKKDGELMFYLGTVKKLRNQ